MAALTLSGCGNAGPGVAAKVGDQTVTVSDVDRLTEGYCRALEPQITAQGQVVPMRLVRTFVAGSLTLQAAAEQLADENDITQPDGYADQVKQVETQSEGLPAAHRDDFVEVGSARVYVTALERQIGAQLLLNEGNPSANDDQKVSRGREELVVWLGEHGVDINPRYGFAITGRQHRRRRQRHVVPAERERRRAPASSTPRRARTRRTPRPCPRPNAAASARSAGRPAGRPAGRVPRRHAPAAGRVRMEAGADARVAAPLPRRGVVGDARGDRLRRPGPPARGARRPAAADRLPRGDRGGGGGVHLRRGGPGNRRQAAPPQPARLRRRVLSPTRPR